MAKYYLIELRESDSLEAAIGGLVGMDDGTGKEVHAFVAGELEKTYSTSDILGHEVYMVMPRG